MSTSENTIVDVVIVGAGPAGLGAALYTARAGLDTLVFGDPYKGQLARAGIIENFLTWVEPVQGLEIVEQMVRHVERWEARFDEREVRQIVRLEDCFQVITADAEAVCAYSVIIATGAKWQKLGVEGEDQYYTKGVGYCTLCDGPLYSNQPVAVVGHGNEAALAALRMSELASHVDLVSNRARLGAEPRLMDRLTETSNLTVYEGMKPVEIAGDGEKVTAFRFRPLRGEHQTEQVDVNAVFVEVGTLPATAIASDLNLELDGPYIKVDREQRTSLPGVFAAGDLTGGQAKQASVAVGDGTKAAISAIDYVKSLGLSAEKSKLQSVQWGESARPPSKPASQPESSQPSMSTDRDDLHDYVAHDPGFQRMYERYTPDPKFIEEIKALQPEARVVVISATWCPDCRRNVPRWARITEQLPGWKNEIYPREDEERARKLGIRAIPTFILYDSESNEELGRIVENPVLGSLEADVLNILRAAKIEAAGTLIES
ncbi:MAG TPA: FAD-dependent oxidoreductase [Ardenticatenaceae bacterium]|jgi:thioredoxin reductase